MLFALMILASAMEVISIGAVVPFLAALTNPKQVFENPKAHLLISGLGLQTPQELLMPLTIIFCLAALLSGATRLLLHWVQVRFAKAIGTELSVRAYKITLNQPYNKFTLRNSSEIHDGIRKVSGLVGYAIQPTLNIIGSTIILMAVVSVLLVVDVVVTLFSLLGFGLIYFSLIRSTRRYVYRNSKIIATHSTQVTKSIQEGVGGIRDIIINGTQAAYLKVYENAFGPMQRAIASNSMISVTPRFGIEAFGMILIASLAFAMSDNNQENANIIPVLGALALGAQRLLPILQQIYSAYNGIRGSQASIQDALGMLDQPMPNNSSDSLHGSLPFKRTIELDAITFGYSSRSPFVINNLSLKIPKGSRVGFIGTTGSGKSTLLDIIMGLVAPTRGTLRVDGVEVNHRNIRAWHAHVAHVPQAIFLADTTIMENIAFGVPAPQIDIDRVKQSARQAQISETIESWVDSYDSRVGERGIRLSGGQRQRIGIARALYKRADVIVFDEATSALDNETEAAVMQAIDVLDTSMTVIIVAHRLSTLKSCNFIVELADGAIKKINVVK